MDCFDIAEKELRKKAAAKADKEQPGKEVKNKNRGKWYVINYAKALLSSGISGEARILADYIISNQGEDWKFYPYKVKLQTGLSEKKYYECLNELESVKAIQPRIKIRNGRKYEAGVKLIWNFNYQTWKSKVKELSQNGNVQNGLSQNGNVQNGSVQNGLSQNGGSINIDKDLISPPGNSEHSSNDLTSLNSEHEEKREGAAAKPQPAPPPGTASQESSFPETAQGQKSEKSQIPLTVPEVMKQGQTDLFGEAAPLPEKPKKDRKAKPFTPPTKEEVRLELESLLAKKGTIQQWSDNDLRAMTEKFFEHYNTRNWEKSNGQKLKDWRASLNTTWLLKQGYLPDRTTRNQPQREGKQIFTAEQLEKLAAGSTDPQQILEQRRERENQKGNVIIQD